jgi:hypothetical protein
MSSLRFHMLPKVLTCISLSLVSLGGIDVAKASRFGGAITAGSGLEGRAILEDTEGVSENPAHVAFAQGYHVRLTGIHGSSLKTSQKNLSQVIGRLAILDHLSETSFPASFVYSQLYHSNIDFLEKDFQINIAEKLNKKTSVGLGLGYRIRPQGLPERQLLDPSQGGPQGPSQEGQAQGKAEGKTESFYAVLGGQYFVQEFFSLGATYSPQDYGVGLGYIFKQIIRLRLDYSNDSGLLSRGRVSFGGEAFSNQWVVLRLGGIYRLSEQSYGGNHSQKPLVWTWGIGFLGPRLRVNYAYAPLNHSLDYRVHWLDLSLPIW